MSELKAYYGDVYIPVYGSIADAQVYLKSEADKVINELEADKLELRQRVNVLGGRLFGLSQSHNVETYTCGILERKIIRLERKIEISDKQLRHSNRNRCLAMAELCRAKRDEIIARTPTLILNHPTEYFTRWENRWLKLAEKFKEAK